MSIHSSKNNRFTMDTLQKYKNSPLYEVPDCYFEQFQHDVMQRVAKEERPQKRFGKWISTISAAASIALIVMLSFFLFVNRNTNKPFYVHEDIKPQDDTILSLELNPLAEVSEPFIETTLASKETLSSNEPVTTKETIVYRAVDFYIDDYETNNFCDMMYDLECYYDY